ncbi:hypothetical protein [Haliovirga abyssi]|uniref:Lipoprotein n=1 Tax=Haliovirga abyssi TaxID=2996794 RepID=A0AAU9E1B5_9FUSO|nr:hypothetical protein [Haliovirga abyssi]BDU50160.1 hypothetical protein HLVA_07290 [Haliovirga abyssi]
MRKIVALVLLFLFGCSNIVLKKEVKEKIPFKIKKGDYKIVLNHIKYPTKYEEKEVFFKKFDLFLKKSLLENKKDIILFDMSFFKDYEEIENSGLLPEEKILTKVASSLNEEEKKKLLELNKKKYIEKDPVQVILKNQILKLKNILEDSTFDESKIYTELDKEELINLLRNKRKILTKVIKKSKIEMVALIKNPYKKIDKIKRKYYTKDINLNVKTDLREDIKKYKYPILIENLKDSDFKLISNSEINLNNKIIILKNSKYVGYDYYKGNYIFYYGGVEKHYLYNDYNINVIYKDVTLRKLLRNSEGITFKELIGG